MVNCFLLSAKQSVTSAASVLTQFYFLFCFKTSRCWKAPESRPLWRGSECNQYAYRLYKFDVVPMMMMWGFMSSDVGVSDTIFSRDKLYRAKLLKVKMSVRVGGGGGGVRELYRRQYPLLALRFAILKWFEDAECQCSACACV